MSRRSSRKTETVPASVDTIESVATTKVSTPRKGRKLVEIDQTITTVASKVPVKKESKAVKPEDTDSELSALEDSDEGVDTKPAKRKINRVKGKATVEAAKSTNSKKAPAKRKAKAEIEAEGANEDGEDSAKPKKKRKTKEEKEAEAMPILPRTAVSTLKKAMHIGAHVSGAGGVQNSINNALHIGGNSFALFLKSQRKWTSPPLAPEARDQFKAFCEEHKYDAAKHVLPHGSYLVNLAQLEADKAEQAYSCFLDDLQRCESLGIKLYNFHPGNAGQNPRPEAIQRIAAQLNKAHKATSTVVTVLENMAGQGNVIGSTWEDLRDIIALIDDKSRVGVCLDTCHAFAAGHDLRSPDAFKDTMNKFDTTVGLTYLKALHLNDSKAPISSNRDLHANIGTGFLGLRAFYNVVNFEPFQDLPMVLETPIDKKGADGKSVEDKSVWATEIKLLEGLIGADPESQEFKFNEKRLFDSGAGERKKIQDQVDKRQGAADKKQQKTLDSMFKKTSPKKKKKKAAKDEESSEDEGGCSH